MSRAVIQVTYDGVTSRYCGVGTVSHAITKSVGTAAEETGDFSYYVVTPLNHEGCLGYDPELLEDTVEACRETGGEVRYISDGSKGLEQFGGVKRWETASASAAGQIIDIALRHEKTLVICQDTPYMKACWLADQQLKDTEIDIVWVPHGTGRNQQQGMDVSYDDWIEFEDSNMEKLLRSESISVGAISRFMRSHLREKYGIPEEKIVDFTDGIHPEMYETDEMPEDVFSELGLDRKPTFLAFGRAERYKGLQDVVSGFQQKAQLLVVANDQTSLDPNTDELREAAERRDNIRIVDGFLEDEKLHALMKHPEMIGVVVSSLAEPFGLIPEEVRILCRESGAVPIVSDVDGLSEQVEDGLDGFKFEAGNAESLNSALERALELDEKERQEMRKKGYEKFSERYDMRKNFSRLLRQWL
ncbi:MAG: glycosyltransferase family 4 protein [Candidatus Nanohaloarchaea archaeon]